MLGDYDLFVILKHQPPQVESLHFYVGGVPIDLNLRTLDEIREMVPASGFDQVLLEARVVYDPTGNVAREIHALRDRHKRVPTSKTPDKELAFIRFGTKHIFDKVKGRLDSDPTLCAFLLHQNVYWLVRNYFCVHDMEFQGEPYVLEFLQQHVPDTYSLIERFYAAGELPQQDLALSIAEAVLAPIGGMWRDDELLAFGEQARGKAIFARLFKRDPLGQLL